MATEKQVKYIEDLAVLKTKEFKEVKELLYSSEIVKPNSEIISKAGTLAAIGNALTDLQASRFIDVLVKAKPPARSRAYATARTRKTIDALDNVKATISEWNFV